MKGHISPKRLGPSSPKELDILNFKTPGLYFSSVN